MTPFRYDAISLSRYLTMYSLPLAFHFNILDAKIRNSFGPMCDTMQNMAVFLSCLFY